MSNLKNNSLKEIGGYIELDRYFGKEYHNKAISLNSGRHALEYLIKAKKIKKLYIPFFLCASIRNLCCKFGCEYDFYEIDADFKPCFNRELNSNEYLYIVNYYGQLTNKLLKKYKSKYKNIIVDNAQDFFRLPVQGVDTLYTCRKFFGVCDGGYLYTDKYIDYDLEVDKSYERIKYVLGRYEEDAAAFYQKSVENNKFFATQELKQMSKLTRNMLRGLEYKKIAKKRTQNFEYLHKRLKNINKLKLIVPYGAFMYPLYVENGKELKKKLIENKIFVPTLWGDVFDVALKGSVSWDFTESIVPLPCDQRYGIEEMVYISNIIMQNI